MNKHKITIVAVFVVIVLAMILAMMLFTNRRDELKIVSLRTGIIGETVDIMLELGVFSEDERARSVGSPPYGSENHAAFMEQVLILRSIEADIIALLQDNFDFVLGGDAMILPFDFITMTVIFSTDIEQSAEEELAQGRKVLEFLLETFTEIDYEHLTVVNGNSMRIIYR